MRYWLQFSIFLAIGCIFAFIGGGLLEGLEFYWVIIIALAFAYVAIIAGRKLLKRERL